MKYVYLLIFIAACAPQEHITIGAVLGTLGSHAYYGQEAQRGIELALQETTNQYNIQTEHIDSYPEQGVKAAQKLLTIDDVDYLLTFAGAGVAIAIMPLANQHKTIQIELICYSPACKVKDDYLFRLSADAKAEFSYLATQVYEQGVTEVAVLYMETAAGNVWEQAFTQTYEKLGGTILYKESFAVNENDFRTLLEKAKKAQAIIFLSYGEAAHALAQKTQLGINKPVYGAETIRDPNVITIAGRENVEETQIAYPGNTTTSTYKNFAKKYESTYGEKPTIYAAKAYDAIKLLDKAIIYCDNKVQCVKAYIPTIRNMPGASTTLTFDEYGDIAKEEFHMQVFINGKWV